MTQYVESRSSSRPTRSAQVSGWVGWIAFAGIMMVMLGTIQVIEGLVALFNDTYYLVRPNGMIVSVDYTAWGWTHLIVGALIFVAGLGVFAGQMWARVIGTILAVLSAIMNIVFMAAYPLWSTLMIGLAVFVILALTVHGSDIKPTDDY